MSKLLPITTTSAYKKFASIVHTAKHYPQHINWDVIEQYLLDMDFRAMDEVEYSPNDVNSRSDWAGHNLIKAWEKFVKMYNPTLWNGELFGILFEKNEC